MIYTTKKGTLEPKYIKNSGGKVWFVFWLWAKNYTYRQISPLAQYNFSQQALINQSVSQTKFNISNIAYTYH